MNYLSSDWGKCTLSLYLPHMHKLIIKSSKFFWLAFLLLLLVDFFQSNYHYSNLPMDGDVARIAAPMLWYEDVLRDPIGIEAITEHKKYSGAGRYVCHVITKWWFTDVFVLIKKIVQDPVNSIYFTATAMAAFLHLLFISRV